MLVAVGADRRKLVASASVRGANPVCPVCGHEVIVRLPARRVAHFAHRPLVRCQGPAKRRRATLAAREVPDQGVLFDLDD